MRGGKICLKVREGYGGSQDWRPKLPERRELGQPRRTVCPLLPGDSRPCAGRGSERLASRAEKQAGSGSSWEFLEIAWGWETGLSGHTGLEDLNPRRKNAQRPWLVLPCG